MHTRYICKLTGLQGVVVPPLDKENDNAWKDFRYLRTEGRNYLLLRSIPVGRRHR